MKRSAPVKLALCLKCHKFRPIPLRSNRRSVRSWCRKCARELAREWRATDPIRYRSDSRQSHLRHRYGISQTYYKMLLAKQEGKCAICGTTDPAPHRHFHVDHEHVNNRIRGLLCGLCNRGLAQFRDDPELLDKARKYLVER